MPLRLGNPWQVIRSKVFGRVDVPLDLETPLSRRLVRRSTALERADSRQPHAAVDAEARELGRQDELPVVRVAIVELQADALQVEAVLFDEIVPADAQFEVALLRRRRSWARRQRKQPLEAITDCGVSRRWGR